ncbi:hypothetical protein, unlikely [Trypanosoma brucei gambiense DAL972]|uniref:Uncharacterized protein n=1 Tax=Trypanosoma brucei gambiense (strain MHOM/CI/86/DAL972) TaxID=679716 RepID=D0A588_TRYB9|nr:hypothetical protein, unlikely [Trypanosoma brucei gambiense DAL972]CBH16432.1 hypothetical protein, unlikely [Trypanosoma brucei gambiense DAL972]|eukprot:XP_011778696.1 hypothetical protein, unlikely [Trypanosoma brucei gambiense DAL972]
MEGSHSTHNYPPPHTHTHTVKRGPTNNTIRTSHTQICIRFCRKGIYTYEYYIVPLTLHNFFVFTTSLYSFYRFHSFSPSRYFVRLFSLLPPSPTSYRPKSEQVKQELPPPPTFASFCPFKVVFLFPPILSSQLPSSI